MSKERSGRQLAALVDCVQTFAGRVYDLEPGDVPLAARKWATALPTPIDAFERLAFGSVLVSFASYLLDVMHHGSLQARCDCYDMRTDVARRFLRRSGSDPSTAFIAWLDWLQPTFASSHPPPIAHRAALLVRNEPAKSWKLATLAKALTVTERRLAMAFRGTYEVSFRDYVNLARLERAIAELTDGLKVEAVALLVGYRSKKDLYRACATFLGRTPANIRQLTAIERQDVCQRIHARLKPAAVMRPPGRSGSFARPVLRRAAPCLLQNR